MKNLFAAVALGIAATLSPALAQDVDAVKAREIIDRVGLEGYFAGQAEADCKFLADTQLKTSRSRATAAEIAECKRRLIATCREVYSVKGWC